MPGDKRLSGTDTTIVKVAMLYEHWQLETAEVEQIHRQLETAEAEQIHKLLVTTIEHESAIDAKDREALGIAIA